MTRTMSARAAMIAALAAATLVGTVTSASAASASSSGDDAYVTNPSEQGLIELYSTPDPGQIGPMNWEGSLGGWGPGNFESRHWADNDYTEIQFTGCAVSSGTGTSVTVKLWQAIPFSLDKDMGNKTFTNCFNGASYTSRGEWNAHYDNGDNRYFTIPAINGSGTIRTTVSVSKVYVDTSLAD
ncbi:hypothetical protein GCM10017562_59110 [Streptomyces roseofulvus]|uniref:Secreted protein n=2 Tax=Streptomyces TaxID=1883 RepID=A0ABU4KIR4_9ACTN|nr:hypothetical protein [Streptomyces roseolus]MDX2297683.1 hypothetical protein [Streptomyces roseolus]